jgi:hypothetical protein
MWAVRAEAQLRLPSVPYADGYTLAASTADPVPPTVAPGVEQQSSRPTPDEVRLRNAGLIATGALLVGAYGKVKWWDDGFTGEFRTENEGWFGQETKYGGADKLGHAYFAYGGTRLFSEAFEAAGNDPGRARALGFWSSLAILTAVEVLDGYSRQYRFSGQDAAMNLVGAGLGFVTERYPDLDRLVDFRFQYKRSSGNGWEPGGDYSGQTYLLVGKATGVPALREHSVLRYFELAVGYGTRGYETPGAERERNLYYGISLNLSEVLGQTVFRGAKERSRAQRATDLFLELIQVPGTAALAHHQR